MFENVNFENSYFSDCLFHDITINNCKGLKNAFFENINFGTIETPVILSDEKALQYLPVSYTHLTLPTNREV